MRFDWKWLIGIIIAIVGVIVPIVWAEIEEIEDFNNRISSHLVEIRKISKDVSLLRAVAGGVQLANSPISLESLNVSFSKFVSAVRQTDLISSFSIAFKDQVDKFDDKAVYLFNDMSNCDFLNSDASLPLELLSEQLSWMEAILPSEKRGLSDYLSKRDPKNKLDRIAMQMSYSYQGWERAGIDGISGCCQARISKLHEKGHLGNQIGGFCN